MIEPEAWFCCGLSLKGKSTKKQMEEKIPEDWLEISYNEIGKFYGGGTPSTRSQKYWNGSIAWTTSKALGDSLYMNVGERSISERGLKESSTTLIPKGNLLIGTRVGVGKVVVNKVDIAISQDLTGVVVNKKKCLPEFIAYQTRGQRLQECFRKQKRGVTIQGVSRDDLKEFLLYLPSLPEQQKIAAILFKIQQASEIQESIIERMQELKKSTMQQVFTHGLRGEKTKETEIGRVPESWTPKQVGSILKLSSGKTRPENIFNNRTSDSSYPVYGGNGIMGYSAEFLVSDKVLILGRVGEYCGAVHVSSEPSWISDNALYSKEWADANVLLDYLAAYLRFFDLNRMKRRSSQPLISQSTVQELNVPIPNKTEQEEIINIFHALDQKTMVHTGKKSALQDLFKTMLNKLMTGEVRVRDLEVDVSRI